MKNLLPVVLMLGLMVLLTSQIIFAQDVDRTFKVNKNGKLELKLNHGNVNVHTWIKDEARILAKNIDSDEVRLLTVEQSGSSVIVRFSGKNSQKFSVDAWVPVEFNLQAVTGGGNIKLNGRLSGKTDISTSGGNISASDIKGKVELSTGGGNISCDSVDGDVEASSGGGDIKIAAVTGILEVSTAGGNINLGKINKSAEISTAGGNINVGDIGGNAEISTSGGNINVGFINASAEVSTGGGNISLAGSNGKVEVSTGGGNFNLKNIGGGIQAVTGAGVINLELSRDFRINSSVSTSAGDIVLSVPENLKVKIVAVVKTHHFNKSDKSYIHIKSEFDGLKYDVDDSRREVVATLNLNGGGPEIKLISNTGKIEIRKK